MAKIYTTLDNIRLFHPCKDGWSKLLKTLNKTRSDQEPVDYLTILESNGVADTIWCMRCEWFEHEEVWMEFVNGCVKRAKKYDYDTFNDAAHNAYNAAYNAYNASNAVTAADAYAAAAAYAVYVAALNAVTAADAYVVEKQEQYNHLKLLLS